MMKNILVLSAGRRVELVEAFRDELVKRSPSSKVYATDLRPEISAACRVADGAIAAPSVSSPEYIAFLLEQCKLLDIGLVVPTIDTELLLLAENQSAFQAIGVNLIISSSALVAKCRDKRKTGLLFIELDIETPTIYTPETLEFPCFAKPYDGSCSKGATLVRTSVDAEKLSADEKIMFMELVDASFSEYTVDLYYDARSNLKCMVPRERLETRAGEVSKGITRREMVYQYLLRRVQRLPGAVGCITLQLFFNKENPKFFAIEINPRFGGGFPLSYSAGANYPGWLIDEYLFGKEIEFFDGWENNLLMLRYDAKVLVHGAT